MKVLITEEQLKLIIEDTQEVTVNIKYPDVATIPSFCGGNLQNDGCKDISDWKAPNGAQYSNSYGDDRDEYIYPCGGTNIGDIIFVRKLKYGGRRPKDTNASTGMSIWRKKAEQILPHYLNNTLGEKKLFYNTKNKKGQTEKNEITNRVLNKFFKDTDIIKIDNANKHLFISGPTCNHPYFSNAIVSPDTYNSIMKIQNQIGKLSVNSAYRDNVHQQMMKDFLPGKVAALGKSNHQDGNALDIGGIGKTETKNPQNKWNSTDDKTQKWLWMVYVGPYFNWCPYGTDDNVHFTYGSNYKSRDCNKDNNWGIAYNLVGSDPTGNDSYISTLCNQSTGSKLLDDDIASDMSNQMKQLKDALWDENKSGNYPGLNKIREWCGKKFGGGFPQPEEKEEELEPTTTRVLPLGDVKINGDNLIVNMGDMESKLGFNLYKKIDNKEEEIPFLKTDGGESMAGQTKNSYGKNETLSFPIEQFLSDTMKKVLPGQLLVMKVSRVIDKIDPTDGAKKKSGIDYNTTKETVDFMIDFQGNILTGSEIDNFYKINRNLDPKYIKQYLDMEHDRIMRGIDNTYVKPNTIPIDLPKIEFKED